MNKIINKIISVIVIGILLLSTASFLISYSIKPKQSIPLSVLVKYYKLKFQYKNGLGAIIYLCTKNNEKIFTVSGSAGFHGVDFYYTEDGEEIGQKPRTDVVVMNESLRGPIDIQEYDCTTLKASKQFEDE